MDQDQAFAVTPACARGVLIAIAVQLVIMGSWPVAAAVLLGFDCYRSCATSV